MELDRWLFPAILGMMFCGMVALCTYAIWGDIEHHRFLEDHGCQAYFEAKTGRYIQTGKIGHDEVVTVYECADGKRTELH